MSNTERGQVISSAAEIYQEFFVPALFQEWTDIVLDAARVKEGQHILDVACGTGVLARSAKKRVGANGRVVGLDINDGMLTVARQISSDIVWKEGNAQNLPFPDNHFDTVVSQFALMFFEDRQSAIHEMLRTVRSGRWVTIAVWGSLEETPGYAKMVKLLQRLFDEDVANGLRAPYNLGDKDVLCTVLEEANIDDYEIDTIVGTARFPSIESWVFTDIKGWVLADSMDDDQYQHLLNEAQKELQTFVNGDGSVSFDAPAHIITITT